MMTDLFRFFGLDILSRRLGLNRWKLKQTLAHPARYYGDGGTYHSSGVLDVGVKDGKVVAVWFRCQQLPFKQYDASDGFAGQGNPEISITGVEILDKQ